MEPITKTDLPAVKLPVAEDKPTVKDEVKRSLLEAFTSLPPWARLSLIAVAIVAVAAWRHFHPAPAPVVNVTIPTPESLAPVAVGAKVESDTERSRKEGHRLFAKVVRSRVAEQLKTDGFALIGGNPKPLTHIEAWALLSNIEDSAIVAAAVETGKVGDGGGLLDTLGKVLRFIVDNREVIIEVVKIILSLLAVFGEPTAWGVIQGPDGWAVWAQYPDQLILVAV